MTAGLLFPWTRPCGEQVEVVWHVTPRGVEIKTVRNIFGDFIELPDDEHLDCESELSLREIA